MAYEAMFATVAASIWACGLGSEEAPVFWDTIKVNYSIWVDFSE
jgi:hypothetical protein